MTCKYTGIGRPFYIFKVGVKEPDPEHTPDTWITAAVLTNSAFSTRNLAFSASCWATCFCSTAWVNSLDRGLTSSSTKVSCTLYLPKVR